jgi:type IV secretory pathway ATPase VirB11/archaellum biosynthesis ATPase
MLLEEVLPHPTKQEIYINQIVTPHDLIRESDRKMVNNILLKEIARKNIEVSQ